MKKKLLALIDKYKAEIKEANKRSKELSNLNDEEYCGEELEICEEIASLDERSTVLTRIIKDLKKAMK